MECRPAYCPPAKVIMSHIMRTRSGIGVRDANWEVDLLCKLGVLRTGGLARAREHWLCCCNSNWSCIISTLEDHIPPSKVARDSRRIHVTCKRARKTWAHPPPTSIPWRRAYGFRSLFGDATSTHYDQKSFGEEGTKFRLFASETSNDARAKIVNCHHWVVLRPLPHTSVTGV